jgi:hypothetical protein
MNKPIKPEPPWKIRLVVKKEEGVVEVKQEDPCAEETPWGAVEVKQEDPSVKEEASWRTAEVKQEDDPSMEEEEAPWDKQVEQEDAEGSPQTPPKEVTSHRKTKKPLKKRKAPLDEDSMTLTHLLDSRNYAAVEAGSKSFGLIPMGIENNVRSLIVHVPRGKQGYSLFQNIRPGGTIRVVLNSKFIKRKTYEAKTLKVRFTTPTKYIPPGAKVSCMTIGVDDAEWQSLMAKPPRI